MPYRLVGPNRDSALITAFGYDMFHSYNRIVTWLSTGAFVAILVKLATLLPSHGPFGR